MAAKSNEQHFISSQLEEIHRYLQQYPDENESLVIMRWISQHAAEFRSRWNQRIFRG